MGAGRQGRERTRLVTIVKKQRQIEDRRSRMGVPLTHEEAARRIQAAIRGFIWRRRIKEVSDQELMFIGMKPKVGAQGGPYRYCFLNHLVLFEKLQACYCCQRPVLCECSMFSEYAFR
jgi:hypothetical protein